MTGRHRGDPAAPSAVAGWFLRRGVPWWLPAGAVAAVSLAVVVGVSTAPLVAHAERPNTVATVHGTRVVYAPIPPATVTVTSTILACVENPGCK